MTDSTTPALWPIIALAGLAGVLVALGTGLGVAPALARYLFARNERTHTNME